VGADRAAVVNLSVDVAGDQRGGIRRDTVGVPEVGIPSLQAEFSGDDAFGEIPLADEQRDDVDLLATRCASTSRSEGCSFQKPVRTSSNAPVARMVSAWVCVGVAESGLR